MHVHLSSATDITLPAVKTMYAYSLSVSAAALHTSHSPASDAGDSKAQHFVTIRKFGSLCHNGDHFSTTTPSDEMIGCRTSPAVARAWCMALELLY
jgi:pectin methylesterase-like acyl-CoA thioesterase